MKDITSLPGLSDYQEERYARLLQTSEIFEHDFVGRSIIIFFKNGERIQFRRELLGRIKNLIQPPQTKRPSSICAHCARGPHRKGSITHD